MSQLPIHLIYLDEVGYEGFALKATNENEVWIFATHSNGMISLVCMFHFTTTAITGATKMVV
jgi:hypothetical protein